MTLSVDAVIATRGVQRSGATRFSWGESEPVELKGRLGTETVYPVLGRRTGA
jgi:adenylate cyclase